MSNDFTIDKMGRIRKIILERNQKIKEAYLKEIGSGKDPDVVMDELAKSNDIGRFYVRTILKEQGIEIERKTEYERSDKDELVKRDSEIVELFNSEIDPEDIAKKFDLTTTRVRQILRSKLGKSFKAPKLKNKLDEIKEALESGLPYDCSCKKNKIENCKCDTIVGRYGKNIIKQIKYNMGYNVFKKALEYKIKDMVKMAKSGKPPKDIANKHNVTLNYTYMILHDNGIRSKITKEDKTKRDKAIWEAKMKKGKSVEEIAEKHELTPTMVRIIISKMKKDKLIAKKSK